jgi:hypothetical protein
VPKPEYWQIVHRRPRYPSGKLPRVKGNTPGGGMDSGGGRSAGP